MAQIAPRTPLDINEAAEYIGTNVRHLRRLVYERRIPFTKVGKFVRFRPSDLDHWLEEHTTRAS